MFLSSSNDQKSKLQKGQLVAFFVKGPSDLDVYEYTHTKFIKKNMNKEILEMKDIDHYPNRCKDKKDLRYFGCSKRKSCKIEQLFNIPLYADSSMIDNYYEFDNLFGGEKYLCNDTMIVYFNVTAYFWKVETLCGIDAKVEGESVLIVDCVKDYSRVKKRNFILPDCYQKSNDTININPLIW